MGTLNLPTIDLVSTLRAAPLNGSPSSQDYNDSWTEGLADLASLAGFLNDVLIPILDGLIATIQPNLNGAPLGLEGRFIYGDTTDTTMLFYNALSEEALSLADSLRILYGIIQTSQVTIQSLDVQITALQAQLSSTNQNDIAQALQNFAASLNSLTDQTNSNTSALAAQIVAFQTNGTNNDVQNLLNLSAGTGITITNTSDTGTVVISTSGSGALDFEDLTSGTNTSAAMVIGSGAYLEPSGSGIIEANEVSGISVSGTPSIGQVLTATSSSTADWQDLTGDVSSVFGRSGDVVAASGDYSYTQINNTPQVDFMAYSPYPLKYAVPSSAGGSTTVQIPSNSPSLFASGDVGDAIVLLGCNSDGSDFWTTIDTYVSSTEITVATSVPNTSVAVDPICVWGTNAGSSGTPAFEDSMPALKTAWLAAAALGKALYVPAGMYAYSSSVDPYTLITPTVYYPVGGLIGDGTFSTYFIANNPAAISPTGFIQFTNSDVYVVMNFSGFSVIGNTLPVDTNPTAGAEVILWTAESSISDIFIVGTSFLRGLHARITGGIISNITDYSPTTYIEIDGSVADELNVNTITFSYSESDHLDSSGLGGIVRGVYAVADTPTPTSVGQCIYFSGLSSGYSVEFDNCFATVNNGLVPVGFHTAGGFLHGCTSDFCQVGYILDTEASARDCYAGHNQIADFVISEGQVPWLSSVDYYVGMYTIDLSGHKQVVSTAGTSGSSAPSWNDSGSTTTDGSVVWTDNGVFSDTLALGVLLETPRTIPAVLPTSGSYRVWNAGTNTTLRSLFSSSFDTSIASSYSPVILSGLTSSLSSTNVWTLTSGYSAKLDIDWVIYCSSAGSAGTLTLTISYTDITGTSQSFTSGSLDLSSKGSLSGNLVVYAGGNVSVSTAISGITGSPVYGIWTEAK